MLRRVVPAIFALACAALAFAEPPAAAPDDKLDDEAPPAADQAPAAPSTAPATAPANATKAPPSESTEAPRINDSTPYKGVAPGSNNLPPRAPKLPLKKGRQQLTWSGFQLRDGTPTVFLETTGAPEYTVQGAPGQLTVTLKNTIAPLRNNRRPLKVEYFKTPVKEVVTTPRGHDLLVTIHTDSKDAPSHKEHVEPAAGGFQLLIIEIDAH